jgi:hypothetical protein
MAILSSQRNAGMLFSDFDRRMVKSAVASFFKELKDDRIT